MVPLLSAPTTTGDDAPRVEHPNPRHRRRRCHAASVGGGRMAAPDPSAGVRKGSTGSTSDRRLVARGQHRGQHHIPSLACTARTAWL